MSRRYPVADLYEERERDVYRSGRRSTREFEDTDAARGLPDFLRDDYGRNSHAGPIVLHGGRDTVDVDVRSRRGSPPQSTRGGRREIEKEEIIIRDTHTEAPPPRRRAQSVSREEFTVRRSVPDLRPRPREVEREEIDINIRRDEDTRSVRSARPREIERDDITIRRSETPRAPAPSRPREVERDEIVIRRGEGGRPAPSRREVETEEIIIRRNESESRPPPPASTRRGGSDELDVDIRRTERRPPPPASSRPPPPPASTRGFRDDIDIDIRHDSRSRPPPSSRGGHRDEIDIDIRREERSAPPPPPAATRRSVANKEEIDINIQHDHRGRQHSPSRERITIREKSRGPPPQLVARETEEFVIRRRRPPSPSPSPPPMARDTITIRQRVERSPSPPPPPPPAPEPSPPPPPPVLEPIIRPPIRQEIIQEIITHHRHIDHGVERARSPTPPPPPPREPTPPPPPVQDKVESLEIDIHRGGRGHWSDEEIHINHRSQSRGPPRTEERSVAISRPRSLSPPQHNHYEDDDEIAAEAEYYNRKALERAYPGEAFNGATKDWAIVDVPPGTERVEMKGAGGGSQEISWQRYNGVRRSKFKTGDREYATDFGEPAPPALAPAPAPTPPAPAPPPPPPAPVEDRQISINLTSSRDPGPPRRRPDDMWTEVTKDLVIKEAIEHMGYDYEETEFFFYVMEYLKYEDVLQLVEVSDEIRRARRRRIREIEWEREDLHTHRDERDYYEREVIIDRRERRY